jgi:hypothetical protein
VAIALLFIAGSAAPARAQWTALANAPGNFLDTCVLLTDGTVMCHVYNTNRWRRLTPDINGSYQNGTWSNTADMPNGNDASFGCVNCTYRPLYFASAVLPDGRVVVVGGEYNPVGSPAVWTNIGFMYDPVADSWSGQLTVPFAGGCVGDASSTVLQNGTLVLADGTDCTTFGNLASFDPATLTFTALNPTGKADRNNEEGWNILPDGTLLTVDARISSQSEIYDPVTNTWGNRTSTVVNLADTGTTTNSREVGPGVLRPDGTVIYFSGNNTGQNALYDTNTGTWSNTAAMDFPLVTGETFHDAVADGPASLLPNGNVLVMASPTTNVACGNMVPPPPPTCGVFNTPSNFYEFDFATDTLIAVTDSPNAASFKAYQGRMVLLPSGQVLLTAYNQAATQDVLLYSNGGAPQDAWRPVITTAPDQVVSGNTYSISGRLFTGLSEGASYGDDAQSSTNYPLVRITNIATGHVVYARTHDHSRMGVVAVSSNEIVTTQFDGPAALEPGPSNLVVVVNGIPSLPIVINRIPTTTTVQPATQDYHDLVTLQATVTPAGVSGTVEFFIDGTSIGLASYNNVTGVATLNYVVQLAAGTYDLRADFTSTSPIYGNSTHTLADGLTVTLEETTLTYTGNTIIANGGAATMSAVLVEDGANDDDGDGGGTAIAGRTVHFTLGTGVSAQTCDGVTSGSGIATCSINPVAQPLGPGVVAASFSGDAYYRSASAGATTMVFAFLEHGSFAVGNLSASMGASVTYWSSQWSKVNTLSGGPAPSTFKGFINGLSVEPPTCGITWTSTLGGNSTQPPATVPSFMGAVVPSTVTASGSTSFGNAVKIVVVQTNPGYSSNPGGAGTGTIVAQFCP